MLVPYNRLSEEQKAIIRRVSREDSSLFVEGPPGSGKTLISLYVLRDMVSSGTVSPLLLMYNHSLYGFLKAAMKELDILDNITIATKDKFFWDLRGQYGIDLDHNDDYSVKYNYILSKLAEIDNFSQRYDVIIVDEVQDLNPLEWKIINKMTDRITSLGDFNQGVYETALTKADVSNNSLVEHLTRIFRFHKGIAKIASAFSRTADNLEMKVDRISQVNPSIIRTSEEEEFNKIVEILKNQQNRRNERVGVIAPGNDELKILSAYLTQQNITHDYYSDNRDLRDHDFTSSTPLLISSFSSKGLEFETVILFGFKKDARAIASLRRKGRLRDVIYVSITRTNSNLYIIDTPDTIQELKDIKIESETNTTASDEDWF